MAQTIIYFGQIDIKGSTKVGATAPLCWNPAVIILFIPETYAVSTHLSAYNLHEDFIEYNTHMLAFDVLYIQAVVITWKRFPQSLTTMVSNGKLVFFPLCYPAEIGKQTLGLSGNWTRHGAHVM